MEFYREGQKEGPILVCIHALMGGPEDYMSYRKKWSEKSQLVLMDMDVEARKLGWADQKSAASVLNYSDKSEKIANYVRNTFPGRRAFFVGISLGGKILYEIAAKHPEIFAGGVVTDTGPGSLLDSEFSSEASEGVYTLNLRQPWRNLKVDLEKKFPDRKTRILISTQIEYQNPEGPGRWKPGLAIIYDLICGSKMENQWDLVEQMNPDYRILILKSLQRSGIGHKDFKRMKQYPVFDIIEVPESNHFFHISSHEYVSQAALYMMGKAERPKLAKRRTSIKLPKVWDILLQGYRIKKQTEKQMITQLTAENLETLHPAIIPNLLKRLEPKLIRKLDREVFRKLDP